MKKIINNKLYNTETAVEIGLDCGGDGFAHWCERLYRKRTGEYFLHGEGGPSTKYAITIGQNSWSGGEKIMPLTYENARQWAEEHLDADDYAEAFGMPDEDGGVETLHVQLPSDLMAAIRKQAAERGLSLRAYVEQELRG